MWGGTALGGGAFFYAGAQFGAGFLNELPGIRLGQLLVVVVAGDGLLDGGDFVLGHVAAAVLAVLPRVEVEVGPAGALADHTEGAVLHVLNLEELFEQRLGSERSVHGGNIDESLYRATKKGPKPAG